MNSIHSFRFASQNKSAPASSYLVLISLSLALSACGSRSSATQEHPQQAQTATNQPTTHTDSSTDQLPCIAIKGSNEAANNSSCITVNSSTASLIKANDKELIQKTSFCASMLLETSKLLRNGTSSADPSIASTFPMLIDKFGTDTSFLFFIAKKSGGPDPDSFKKGSELVEQKFATTDLVTLLTSGTEQHEYIMQCLQLVDSLT